MAAVDEQIQRAREGQEGYSLTLDTSTQAGRDNLSMLNDLASNAQTAAEAQFALDGNTNTYKASLEAGRQSLIDRATDLGYNAEQAQALADQIFRIPTETEWKVIADTNEAQERVNRLSDVIAGLRDKTVRINVQMPNGTPVSDEQLADQFGIRRAYGGPVYGPGGPRDDKVPAMLSDGEHVIAADEVQAAGGHNAVMAWRRSLMNRQAPLAHQLTADGPEAVVARDDAEGIDLVGGENQRPDWCLEAVL